MKNLDIQYIEDEFVQRIDDVQLLMDTTHDDKNSIPSDVQKNIRGLAIVTLFGTYERLLHQLCTEIVETASSFKGNQKRLQLPFRIIGLSSQIKALRDPSTGKAKLWTEVMPQIVDASKKRANDLDKKFWPDSGDYMKYSQLKLFCDFFHLQKSLNALGKVNNLIDGIVAQRNRIAHGESSPAQIGSTYSPNDIYQLVSDWKSGWIAFLNSVLVITADEHYWHN
ncbi:HEPN domain-containing protein [Bifidobacterium catenulatum]|uniref:HEPN domain-containing protein n=1 Tax=Bifidobacterium catenulatum TaxID=1686 RepID=UPI002549D1D9|nr:HEPN domain-containing protein [Bifidobacterium catenulatum]MDK9933667.1 hypothetical protein [Bifidobacterium catenulatum]